MTIEEFMEFVTVCKVDPKSQIFIKEESKEEYYFKSSSFEHDAESGVLSINVFKGVISLKEAKNINENELKKNQDEQIERNNINEMKNLESIVGDSL